jgi:type VI secretion system ImpJ/VasE family protein
VLLTRLKNFRDLLIGRSRDFGQLARQRGVRATSAGAQDVLRVVMLQSINRYVPAFQHFLEQGHAHPELLYYTLRELIGELSSYTDQITALGETIDGDQLGRPVPPYDHENIWFCFDFVLSLAHQILIGLTASPEMGIRLVYDGEYFRANLPPSFFQGERNRYYFVIDSKLPGPEMLQLLQRTGKLSTIEEMPKLREAALFGLRIDHLPVPPEELPQRNPRFVYFSINTESPVWKRIREGGNIAMFGRLDPAETLARIVKVSGE